VELGLGQRAAGWPIGGPPKHESAAREGGAPAGVRTIAAATTATAATREAGLRTNPNIVIPPIHERATRRLCRYP
jgi:hypothetical protein